MADDKKDTKKDGKKTRIPSAQKRHTQSLKKRAHNRSFEAKVKTAIRSFEDSISKGDKNLSSNSLNAVYSLMDKGVKTGQFKGNKAARTKSRLCKRLPA